MVDSQSLRLRLPLLKQIGGAVITLLGSDKLQPKASEYALKMHVSPQRLKRMDAETYTRTMARSKFCLCPIGDISSPGQRLYDAIGAGCVPIIVGVEERTLPFARQLEYTKFAAFLSRTLFLKDPVYQLETLMHRLTPGLPSLQRALVDARHRLLYGVLTPVRDAYAGYGNLSSAQPQSFGDVGTLLLRETALAVAFGTTTF